LAKPCKTSRHNEGISQWHLERNLQLRTALRAIGDAPGSTLSAFQTALIMAIDAPNEHLNGPLAKENEVIQKPPKGSTIKLPDLLEAFSCFANHRNADDYVLDTGHSLLKKVGFSDKQISELHQQWIASLTPPPPEEGKKAAQPKVEVVKTEPDVIDKYVSLLQQKLGVMEINPRNRIVDAQRSKKDGKEKPAAEKIQPRKKTQPAAERAESQGYEL